MQRVLFVCLGNICRSPTAHGVFERIAASQIAAGDMQVDSCGTGAWHVGEAPDRRAQAKAQARGYDLSHLRARKLSPQDFYTYDYILAMDLANLEDIRAVAPGDSNAHIGLFLEFGDVSEKEVPDPYYGGDQGFEHVLDLVESASRGLLNQIGNKRS